MCSELLEMSFSHRGSLQRTESMIWTSLVVQVDARLTLYQLAAQLTHSDPRACFGNCWRNAYLSVIHTATRPGGTVLTSTLLLR